MAGGWHQFRAPIDGKSFPFSMRCEDGVPQALFAIDDGQGRAPDTLCFKLADLNGLIRKGMVWEIVRTQHQGDLGAVIEAAEARRVEIYGEALP